MRPQSCDVGTRVFADLRWPRAKQTMFYIGITVKVSTLHLMETFLIFLPRSVAPLGNTVQKVEPNLQLYNFLKFTFPLFFCMTRFDVSKPFSKRNLQWTWNGLFKLYCKMCSAFGGIRYKKIWNQVCGSFFFSSNFQALYFSVGHVLMLTSLLQIRELQIS